MAAGCYSSYEALTLNLADDLLSICSEVSQHSLLQLIESCDIEIDNIIEKSDPTSNDRTSVEHWQECKTDAWSEVTFTG